MRYDNNARLNDICDEKSDGDDDENFISLRCSGILVSFEFYEYVMTLKLTTKALNGAICSHRRIKAFMLSMYLNPRSSVSVDLNMMKVKQYAIQSITKPEREWFSWKDLMKPTALCSTFPSIVEWKEKRRACLQLWLRCESVLRVEKDGRWNDLTTGGGDLLPQQILAHFLREIYDCHVALVA